MALDLKICVKNLYSYLSEKWSKVLIKYLIVVMEHFGNLYKASIIKWLVLYNKYIGKSMIVCNLYEHLSIHKMAALCSSES